LGLFVPKPAAAAQYNPLQKLAYSSSVLLGALLLLTGIVMYKPVQFSALGVLVGAIIVRDCCIFWRCAVCLPSSPDTS
jgi:thiosulfate reductase cytochrome b subunit